MDDATSAIYSAFLVEEEGTASTFRALNEGFGRHGLPLSLYPDRGSHYFTTPEAGGKVERALKPQIPASTLRAHFVKARVKVRQYHDGTHAIFHGPRCLGHDDQKGAAMDYQKAA